MNAWTLLPRASTVAGDYDALFGFLTVVSGIMTVLIAAAVVTFAVRYRRRSENDPPPKQIHGSWVLETTWSVIPLLIMLVMFAWGARLYFQSYAGIPENTLDIFVTGKQWMWKLQHPAGNAEINELHIPAGRPVKLILASEDVIHSFFVPAFRLKHDVVPGSYQTFWFVATTPGRYHLFCAEYCGRSHSDMVGWVTVLTPAEYENWLSTGSAGAISPAKAGAELFQRFGCAACHLTEAQGRCPSLRYVFGRPVPLEDGRTVMADEAYIRESILVPNAKIVKGYPRDVMPSFQGQIDEAGLMQLIAYIKSLSTSSEAGQ